MLAKKKSSGAAECVWTRTSRAGTQEDSPPQQRGDVQVDLGSLYASPIECRFFAPDLIAVYSTLQHFRYAAKPISWICPLWIITPQFARAANLQIV